MILGTEVSGSSYSHRGFSPVHKGLLKIKETVFNGFFWQVNKLAAKSKTVKTVQDFGMLP